jgi:hypothetical protein
MLALGFGCRTSYPPLNGVSGFFMAWGAEPDPSREGEPIMKGAIC